MADLELEHISKTFDGVYALKDVSFSCNRGEVHALLGENGAGKSTLLKVLSGAHKADAGEIRLFGRAVTIHNPRDAMAYGIGTVYQELSIVPDLTVGENIFIGRLPKNRFGKIRQKELRKMTLDLFQKYKVDDIDPDAKTGPLSLSKRQMIEILRVLSKDPKVVILDEATSALTQNRVQWLLDLARKLAEEGKIIIFISHRMAEIKDGCDNVTILRNGSTVGTLSLQNVNMDEVISMMLGRKMSGYYPVKTPAVQKDVMLDVSDLRYGHSLNGVAFQLHKGEVLGVGGLAGQGEAELLLALYGMLDAHGTVLLNGKPAKLNNPRESLKSGIALVPEDRGMQGLLLSFPIGFNISLPCLARLRRGPFIDRAREKQTIDQYMKELNVKAESPEVLAANLSGGNQQKVVLAKMLAMEPSLLLMHDITRGVDIGTKKEMFSLVRELAAKGNSILFYSTDGEELVNICDRILVMYDGRVNAVLDKGDLTRENIISASIGEALNA